MRSRPRTAELVTWGFLAFVGGLFPASVDLRPVGVQTPALMLMIVNFALTLPGRAPALLVAVASWLAMPAARAVKLHEFNPAIVVAIVPALIAAFGGRAFGSLLDTAAAQLEPPPEQLAPWYQRPLSKRFLLAVSLIFIAGLGLFILNGVVPGWGFRAPASWLVMVWSTMSLLGWIALAPFVLRERPILRRLGDDSPGIRPLEFVAHLVIVAVLAIVHTAVIVGLSIVLAIPILDRGMEFVPVLFKVFLPLDLLAYLSILSLGFASDVERHRRVAAQRTAAIEAESLENRLSALRARLNPHFLFNALNTVSVLARSKQPSQAADVVDGVTSLLRYVLDDRRAAVPLREELEFARRYLAVQRVRFGDRLTSNVTSSPEADAVLVPQLLLQPIVENAVEHGTSKVLDGGSVTIDAAMIDRALHVSIVDDGPGPSNDAGSNGIGLASTRERLNHLYGPSASIRLERASDAGGTRVDIVLPLAV